MSAENSLSVLRGVLVEWPLETPLGAVRLGMQAAVLLGRTGVAARLERLVGVARLGRLVAGPLAQEAVRLGMRVAVQRVQGAVLLGRLAAGLLGRAEVAARLGRLVGVARLGRLVAVQRVQAVVLQGRTVGVVRLGTRVAGLQGRTGVAVRLGTQVAVRQGMLGAVLQGTQVAVQVEPWGTLVRRLVVSSWVVVRSCLGSSASVGPLTLAPLWACPCTLLLSTRAGPLQW
jgi:hypothetical protein